MAAAEAVLVAWVAGTTAGWVGGMGWVMVGAVLVAWAASRWVALSQHGQPRARQVDALMGATSCCKIPAHTGAATGNAQEARHPRPCAALRCSIRDVMPPRS
ncbi:hypothetical protein V8C86DRAFT_1681164 [Haematococcus lacustris]